MTESAKLARYWGRLAKIYDDNALLAAPVLAGCTDVESGGAT
jgi:hypothetical protein